MLVLSRKVNEEIVIAGNIRVKVIEVKGNQVRLGIMAPSEVPVHRAEVQRAIEDFRMEEEFAVLAGN